MGIISGVTCDAKGCNESISQVSGPHYMPQQGWLSDAGWDDVAVRLRSYQLCPKHLKVVYDLLGLQPPTRRQKAK